MINEKKIYAILCVSLVLITIGVFRLYINTHTKKLDININELVISRDLANNWLKNNLQTDGFFLYELNPVNDVTSTDSNDIRQLMASRVLAKICAKKNVACEKHNQNINAIINSWYKTQTIDGVDIAYVQQADYAKLGAIAMLLRVLTASPEFSKLQQEARYLYNGILSLQNNEGSFEPYFNIDESKYNYDKNDALVLYAGQAILSLIEYYELVGEERILNKALLSADFYHDRYVNKLHVNYNPRYVPWISISFAKLYAITGDIKFAKAVLVLNDKLLELQDTSIYAGRFYNKNTPHYGDPHTSSDALYTEGLAWAYEIAVQLSDNERIKHFGQALELATNNLLSLQYTDNNELMLISPKLSYVGSFKTNVETFLIRLDSTQHAIDAFDKVIHLLYDG